MKYNNQIEQNITSSVSFNKNVWSYVTVTMKDNKATMYINGESVASGNITVSMSCLLYTSRFEEIDVNSISKK